MNKLRIRYGLRVIGDIFVPLLPGIICAGLCAGIASLISQAVPHYADVPVWAFIYQILTLIHSSMMTFLTAWAGYRASERFGGTPILGGMLGMITSLEGINFIAMLMGLYNTEVPLDSILRSGKGGVLAVIAGALLVSYVEKAIRAGMPKSIDVVFTPLLTMLLCVTPYVIFIMPLFGYASGGIVKLFSWACMSENPVIRVLSGYIGAALFLPLVATGMHHGLVSLYNVQLQELGLLGVGEPLIYGVTLPLGKPFLTAGLGAGFGGAFIMLTGVASAAWGPSGLLGAFVMTAGRGGPARSVLLYLTALVISYIGGYFITKAFYREEELNFDDTLFSGDDDARLASSFARLSRKKPRSVKAGEPLELVGRFGTGSLPLTAPVDGETVPMRQIPDIIFSSGVIGSCIGILPDNGRILAPCSGVISEIADTSHAITLREEDGMEILLIAGIDTFSLNGRGLSPLVKAGDSVTAGQPIMEMDLSQVRSAGLSPMVITVLSNP